MGSNDFVFALHRGKTKDGRDRYTACGYEGEDGEDECRKFPCVEFIVEKNNYIEQRFRACHEHEDGMREAFEDAGWDYEVYRRAENSKYGEKVEEPEDRFLPEDAARYT